VLQNTLGTAVKVEATQRVRWDEAHSDPVSQSECVARDVRPQTKTLHDSGASRSRQMIDTNHRVRVVMLYADSIGSYKQRRLRIYSTPVRGHLSRISLSSTAMPGVMVFVDSPTCASNLRKVEAAYTGRPKGLSSRAGESAENPSRHSKSAPCQERDFL